MAAEPERKRTLKGKTTTTEEIYNGFQYLRNEQRSMAVKLSEIELELNEHTIVLDTLKDIDGDRKCFRMIGGVLCEKTVKDVVPFLKSNKEQLSILTETLKEKLTKKGVEINEYKEKHNIRIRGQEEIPLVGEEEEDKTDDMKPARNHIMVNPVI